MDNDVCQLKLCNVTDKYPVSIGLFELFGRRSAYKIGIDRMLYKITIIGELLCSGFRFID